MNMVQQAYYPRKIRTVTTGGKTQHLMSIPRNIAEQFQRDLFTCTVEDGRIVFTPIGKAVTDAA